MSTLLHLLTAITYAQGRERRAYATRRTDRTAACWPFQPPIAVMSSVSSELQSSLKEITDRLAVLIRGVPVKYFDRSSSDIIVVAPRYYWGEPTAEQRNAQLKLKRDYEEWIELLRSVLRGATNDVNRQLKEADQAVRIWLELGTNWALSSEPNVNEQKLRADAAKFSQVLAILDSGTSEGVILVPDTNSLVGAPDPAQYRPIAGGGGFMFLLLPTVLSELDELKNLHRNPDFREKVVKVITRVKGWRAQGSLRDGVTVDRNIIVRAIANEPNMRNALSWLDGEIKDDRIIASVLEIQSSHPTAEVALVTGDINLANKAAAARIRTCEI